MMRTLMVLCLLMLSLSGYSQISFNEILDNSSKGLDVNIVDNKYITKKNDTTFVVNGKYEFLFYADTVNYKNYIKINEFVIDSIYKGNSYLEGLLNSYELSDAYGFRHNNNEYLVVSLNLKNTFGSFSRIYACIIISLKQKRAFYFYNSEVPHFIYFRINNFGKLAFTNFINSENNPEQFKMFKKGFYYKINLIELQDNLVWLNNKKEYSVFKKISDTDFLFKEVIKYQTKKVP